MAQVDAGLAVVSRYRLLEKIGDPAAPAAGYGYFYYKSDGLYLRQADGTIVGPLGVPYTEGARVYNSADITIANGSWVKLTFNSERYDHDAIHSTISNTGRLTCKTAGLYYMHGQIYWVSHATDSRGVRIFLNNTTIIGDIYWQYASRIMMQEVSTVYELSVGDYIELEALQISGGNLDITADANYSPVFLMSRIG